MRRHTRWVLTAALGVVVMIGEVPSTHTPISSRWNYNEHLFPIFLDQCGACHIDGGTAPMILDVRTAEEFAEGHVPGAINISHDELADRLAEVAAAKEAGVIVYCRSGRRAGIAEELLLGHGFSNVQHLEGDMLAWLEAKRPTEKRQ